MGRILHLGLAGAVTAALAGCAPSLPLSALPGPPGLFDPWSPPVSAPELRPSGQGCYSGPDGALTCLQF